MPPKKSAAAKKKKNLGSARGFATVSVPRRVEPAEEEEAAAKENGEASAGAEAAPGATDAIAGADKAPASEGQAGETNGATVTAGAEGENGKKGDWDDTPEALERKELQELAERIKPGCDKEVSRIVKVRRSRRRVGAVPVLIPSRRLDRPLSTSAACQRRFRRMPGKNATWSVCASTRPSSLRHTR